MELSMLSSVWRSSYFHAFIRPFTINFVFLLVLCWTPLWHLPNMIVTFSAQWISFLLTFGAMIALGVIGTLWRAKTQGEHMGRAFLEVTGMLLGLFLGSHLGIFLWPGAT